MNAFFDSYSNQYKTVKSNKPLIASLGVLIFNPMLFQKRVPPFPGLLPFPDFFELKTTNTFPTKSKTTPYKQ
jgi:hypothetical protein